MPIKNILYFKCVIRAANFSCYMTLTFYVRYVGITKTWDYALL